MNDKTYSEEEVSDIIGQAARLQALEGTAGRQGLTLAEIKQVAREAGIDPRFIEISSSQTSEYRKETWSLPTQTSRSMFIEGELSDEAWNSMVRSFMATFGGAGEVDVQGARRTWKRDAIRITAEESGGMVSLIAEADWGSELELPIAFLIVGSIATVMLGLVSVLSGEPGLGMIVLLLSLLIGGSFAMYRKKRIAKQEALLQTFETTLNASSMLLGNSLENESNTRATALGQQDEPRIPLPDDDLLDGAPGVDELPASQVIQPKQKTP